MVLVANPNRVDDLVMNPGFARFVADELVPALRARWHAGLSPRETTATGTSAGGLAAGFLAFHHPDEVGNVLSQSGSFPLGATSFESDIPPTTEGNDLIREIVAAPPVAVNWYLEAGLFEPRLRDSNRHLRDVLIAKGYPVKYRERSGGHDYGIWRETIADGLMALVPPRPR